MNRRTLSIAIYEAERFVRIAKIALAAIPKTDTWTYTSKENGAAKRASMDLTRALAELRKPS